MKSILVKLEKTLRKIRMFKKRETIKQVEEGNDLAPKFDKNGFIPVVTTDVGGLSEYVDDGSTGILVEANNPEKLSEALDYNLKNNYFEEFSKNIKEYKKKFSWEYFIQGIEEISADL